MALRAFVTATTSYTVMANGQSVIRCNVAYIDDIGEYIALGSVQGAEVDVTVAVDATPQQISAAIGSAVRNYPASTLGLPAITGAGTVIIPSFTRA